MAVVAMPCCLAGPVWFGKTIIGLCPWGNSDSMSCFHVDPGDKPVAIHLGRFTSDSHLDRLDHLFPVVTYPVIHVEYLPRPGLHSLFKHLNAERLHAELRCLATKCFHFGLEGRQVAFWDPAGCLAVL